ncbi:MAG: alpha/beta fold hydrolase [Gemmatimonadetes bacterium]|nr:alpha/beta fold hydrolase [Gemmatimonadota bacterium]
MRWVDLVRAVALPLAALAAVRAVVARRIARDAADRLGPLDDEGVVRGAEAVALDAGPRTVLLLHGFGDTPESLAGLARSLHAQGWTVRVPLLPGHGRTVAAFAASRRTDWEAAARAAHAALAGRGPVALVGQSMGAALAVQLAAAHPETPALVLLAPLLSLTPELERGERWWWLLAVVRPLLDSRDDRSILDPTARDASRGYGVLPVRLVPELVGLVRAAVALLSRVRVPVRIIQSRDDNRVSVAGTEAAFARIGSRTKDLVWRTNAGHVVSVDTGRDAVWSLVAAWLTEHSVEDAARSA